MEKSDERLLVISVFAGVIGGILVFVARAVFFFFLPQDVSSYVEVLEIVVDNADAFLLVVIINFLAIPFYVTLIVGLYKSLRITTLGLLGTVFLIVGTAINAVVVSTSRNLLTVATQYAQFSDSADRAVLLVVFRAMDSQAGDVFAVAILSLMIGFILIGGAMWESGAYHKGFAFLSVIFGILILVNTIIFPFASVVGPPFTLLVNGIFDALLPAAWAIILGLKLYSLRKAKPLETMDSGTPN